MITRTSNLNNKDYKDYGGRGITVCDEWKDASTFINWARSHGYSDDLLLDRKDNDKGYSPENCHFVTHSESNINKRSRLKDSNYGIHKLYYKDYFYYQIQIQRNKKFHYGGTTRDKNEAIQMRDRLVNKLIKIS